MMKIAFFEVKDHEEKIFKEKLKGHKLSFYKEALNEKNASKAKDSDIISIFVYSKANKQALEKISNLKLITTRSTGFDHIDLEYCKNKGIIACNVPVYAEHSVAEHAMALLLAISRNITKSYVRIHKNNFSIEGLEGFDISGKTIGILGTGHIGIHMMRMAKGFEMKIIAYSKGINKELERKEGFQYVKFNELLKKSDIISIHLPLNTETKHLINKETIKKMKKGVIIINTARGEIIDTKALIDGIKKGIIGGAGLDVIEGENIIKKGNHQKLDPKLFRLLADDHKILNNEKVIFTPHIAFYSKESSQNLLNSSIENIQSFINNKTKNSIIK
ncbi:MAG: NAD(P)-dependent oxidoreductase [Nanoarchaeota archaeon]